MISIHQSQFLPWVPYFYKVSKSDIFVILDDVQFQRNGIQNRNKIKTPQGAHWITVPVSFNFGDPINKVVVAQKEIYAKLLKTLESNYKKSNFFKEVYAWVESIFLKKLQYLNELNIDLFQSILQRVGLNTTVTYSSQLGTEQKKDDLVIEIIKRYKETDYLSGKGALGYMDLNKFKKENIHVYTYDFEYREYPQLWNRNQGFVPDLSVIDLMFNDLDGAAGYISGNGTVRQIV